MSAKSTELSQNLADGQQLQDCGQLALETAKRCGADAASVGISTSTGLSAEVRQAKLESVEFQQDNDLGITVYFGQRSGHASTADLRADSIIEIVQAACTIAQHTQEDPAAGLADAEDLAQNSFDLQLDHPQNLSVEAAQDYALRCEAAAFAHDARIKNSDGASFNAHRGRDVLMTSHGFCGQRDSTDYSLSVAVIAEDNGDMQRDYWYRRDLNASVFEQAEAIGQRAGKRVIRRLQPQKLSTRKAPVLFPPELARGLLGHFISAISGSAIYRRSSFLLEKMDQSVFPDFVQIQQNPHVPGRYGCSWHDGEGVATRDLALVEDGRLQSWLLGSYSARKLNLKTTGNAGGLHSTEISPNRQGGLNELMQEAGTGLLVTELMGQGVNMSSGDYSRGAAGIWFENGQPTYPVAEITIASNLIDMYRQMIAIGNDLETSSTLRCGSVLLDEMTIAGN